MVRTFLIYDVEKKHQEKKSIYSKLNVSKKAGKN